MDLGFRNSLVCDPKVAAALQGCAESAPWGGQLFPLKAAIPLFQDIFRRKIFQAIYSTLISCTVTDTCAERHHLVHLGLRKGHSAQICRASP